MKNIYLGIDHILLEAERWNAQSEHAAQNRLLLKDRDRITLESKVIGTAQTRRSAADHGDLLRILFPDLVHHFWYIALFGRELTLRYELLDLVYRHRRINISARAGFLAFFVAYPPADRGERYLFLYKLKCFIITAFGCKLDITLHRYMRRAGGLAWRGSFRHNIGAVYTVIRIIAFAAPQSIARRIRRSSLVGRSRAELLAELYRVELAVFNTLTAGDAFILVHFSYIICPYRIRRAEVSRDAERKAGAAAAVADGSSVIIAWCDIEFVDKPVVLGAL